MNYKDFTPYTDEMMGDVLRELKENGGSMLRETMNNCIYEYYENKFGEKFRNSEPAFMKKLNDIYIELEREGAMECRGNSLYILRMGKEALQDKATTFFEMQEQIRKADKAIQRKKNWYEVWSLRGKALWIGLLAILAIVTLVLIAIGCISSEHWLPQSLRTLIGLS